MDSDRMRAILAEAESELANAEARVTHLRGVVQGLRGLLGLSLSSAAGETERAPRPTSDPRPTGQYLKPMEAVIRALHEHPNRPVTFREVWGVILDRGWVDPEYKAYRNAADAALRRLAANSDAVRRLPDGSYVFTPEPSPHEPAQPPTDSPSPTGPGLFTSMEVAS